MAIDSAAQARRTDDATVRAFISSTFFVCMLGQRYGWVPPADDIVRDIWPLDS